VSDNPTPTLGDVLVEAIEARLADVHVGMPGRVVCYDAAKQTADVEPLVKRRHTDESGELVAVALAIVNAVPVVFEGGGGFGSTFPLAAGDTVWLAFASCSLEQWKRRGSLVDPEDDRTMHLSDAVCYPGLRDLAHPRTSAPTDRARFGKDGGVALEVTSSEVLVGGGAGHEPTVKYTTRNTAEQTFLTALGVYLAALGTATGLSGPAATFATALSTFVAALPATATTIAKVK